MSEAQLKACLVADKIVCRLDADIRDRKGLKHEWSAIDQTVMNYELRPAWIKIIMEEMVLAGYREPEAVPNAGNIAGSISANGSVRPFNDWWCGKGKRAVIEATPCMQHADRNEWGIAEAGARAAWAELHNEKALNEKGQR